MVKFAAWLLAESGFLYLICIDAGLLVTRVCVLSA